MDNDNLRIAEQPTHRPKWAGHVTAAAANASRRSRGHAGGTLASCAVVEALEPGSPDEVVHEMMKGSVEHRAPGSGGAQPVRRRHRPAWDGSFGGTEGERSSPS